MEKIKRLSRCIKELPYNEKVMFLYEILKDKAYRLCIDKKKATELVGKWLEVIDGRRDNYIFFGSDHRDVTLALSWFMEMNESEQNVFACILFREVYEEMKM